MILSKFRQYVNEYETVSVMNIDEIFRTLNELEIKEVTVNMEEMDKIIRFYLANVVGDKNGNQAEVIKENKLDRFMGVDLILNESN